MSTPGRTGTPWLIGGIEAQERLMGQINRRSAHSNEPTVEQVQIVLHALADHTALQEAVNHRPDGANGAAGSVGRWLHDLADYLQGNES